MPRTTVLVSTIALAASAALAGSGGASATPAWDGSAPELRSAHERVVDYWTPARRESAVPRVVSGPESRGKGGKPGGGGDGTVTGAYWDDPSAPVAKTTGKVFFVLDGTRYTCSGSAVAASANVVLTAGHCVWDDAAKFATEWMFIPGYTKGDTLDDAWTATALFTTASWQGTDGPRGNAWADDTGMAVVTDGAGGRLDAALGVSLPGMAARSGSSSEGQVHSAFGYPAAQKYKGDKLAYCQGPVSLTYDAHDTMSMACDMTGGSSGGPWYSGPNGQGEIVSVNSYGYRGLARMFGPTFNEQEAAMRAAAEDGSCNGSDTACTTLTTSH